MPNSYFLDHLAFELFDGFDDDDSTSNSVGGGCGSKFSNIIPNIEQGMDNVVVCGGTTYLDRSNPPGFHSPSAKKWSTYIK